LKRSCAINLQNKLSIKLILSTLTIWFIPSVILVVFGASSYAIGLLFALILVFLIHSSKITIVQFKRYELLVLLLIAFFLLLSSFITFIRAHNTKPLLSAVPFMGIVFFSLAWGKIIKEYHISIIINSILIILCIFFVIGWLNFFYPINVFGYIYRQKSVFPFVEESHFALALGVLSLGYSTIASTKMNYVIGINTLLLALIYPNLTLLVFFALLMVLYLVKSGKNFGKYLLLFFLVSILLVSLLTQIDYFRSRLTFREVTNLTTLVYLQGWELAFNNLHQTQGFGVGYQQLGSNETVLGHYSERIFALYGKHINLDDGGFLASKIIAEFGFLGLSTMLAYLILFVGFLYIMWRNFQRSPDDRIINTNELFVLGLFIGFFVEIFFRGFGYFSPNLVLIIAYGQVISKKNKRLEKKRDDMNCPL